MDIGEILIIDALVNKDKAIINSKGADWLFTVIGWLVVAYFAFWGLAYAVVFLVASGVPLGAILAGAFLTVLCLKRKPKTLTAAEEIDQQVTEFLADKVNYPHADALINDMVKLISENKVSGLYSAYRVALTMHPELQ